MWKSLAMIWVLSFLGSAVMSGAEQTWTGKISDNLCGTSHEQMAQRAGISDRECVVECVKAGGRYVFVDKSNKIFPIENQDYAGLAQYPSREVTLTGELRGDAIVVSSVKVAATDK